MALDNFFTGLNQGYAQQALINNNQLNTLGALTKQAADAYKIDESQNTRANREAQINALNFYNTELTKNNTDKLFGQIQYDQYKQKNSIDPASGQLINPVDLAAQGARSNQLSGYGQQFSVDNAQSGALDLARKVAPLNPYGAFRNLASTGYYGAEGRPSNFIAQKDGGVLYRSPNGQLVPMDRNLSVQSVLNPAYSQTLEQRDYAQRVADEAGQRQLQNAIGIQDNNAENMLNLARVNNEARRDVALLKNPDGTDAYIPPLPSISSVIAPPQGPSNNAPLGAATGAAVIQPQAAQALTPLQILQQDTQKKIMEINAAGLGNTPEGARAIAFYDNQYNSANQKLAMERQEMEAMAKQEQDRIAAAERYRLLNPVDGLDRAWVSARDR